MTLYSLNNGKTCLRARVSSSIAVLNKVRYALCPMPYALCPISESTSCY
ncbi:hypothetical protein [Microcoleus sp.]